MQKANHAACGENSIKLLIQLCRCITPCGRHHGWKPERERHTCIIHHFNLVARDALNEILSDSAYKRKALVSRMTGCTWWRALYYLRYCRMGALLSRLLNLCAVIEIFQFFAKILREIALVLIFAFAGENSFCELTLLNWQ